MRLGLILSILFLISILPSKAVYAGDGSMTQGDSSYNKWVDHGLKDDHMGWLYYLVDPSTNEQKSTTEAVACNNYGIEYSLGSTRKGVEDIRLKSRFGVNYDAVTKGIPKWGKPYTRSGTAFNGRGDIVKRFLLSHETKVINGKKLRGKHAMAYGVIARAWNKELADKWENKELLLVFEPFFWNGVYADKLVNGTPSWKWEGKYICATALNMGKYQLEREKIGKIHSEGPWAIYDGSNGVYPHCVMLESGQTILGMSISKSQYAKRNSRITNAEMAIPAFGFGVGVVWTKKQEGIINTYDGSHSPGKPESTSKKKNTTGRSTIIKQYWEERTDQNGEIEYVNIGSETNIDYYREKTVKNIIITDEENLPTGNPQGYKLVGWFTGNDLDKSTDDENKANPTPGKELTARLKKAREKFRGKTNEETITLGEDKNTKKKYKGENSLVVVFLRKKAVEGIIDTYNGEDSPGSPEDPSNDKTKQGKKKILKQYWDIQNKQIQRKIYTLENYLQKYCNLQTQCMSRLHRIFTVTEE